MNNRIHGSSTTSCGACSSSTNDDDESSSTGIFQNLHIYMRQPKGIAWGGIGLAFLYFNVLSFGGIMTTYLVSRGMSLKTIGLWRGISSAIGLLGTGVFDCSLRQNWKLEQTGLASVVWQFVWLGVCLLSVVVDDGTSNSLALALLILGVLPSRIGLWVYDTLNATTRGRKCTGPCRWSSNIPQCLHVLVSLLTWSGVFQSQSISCLCHWRLSSSGSGSRHVYIWTLLAILLHSKKGG